MRRIKSVPTYNERETERFAQAVEKFHSDRLRKTERVEVRGSIQNLAPGNYMFSARAVVVGTTPLRVVAEQIRVYKSDNPKHTSDGDYVEACMQGLKDELLSRNIKFTHETDTFVLH